MKNYTFGYIRKIEWLRLDKITFINTVTITDYNILNAFKITSHAILKTNLLLSIFVNNIFRKNNLLEKAA